MKIRNNHLKGGTVHIFGNNSNIFEDIKSRMRSRTACSHLVQSLLSFSMLSRNMKIKTDNSNLACCFSMGETWSVILRDLRPRVFENRVAEEDIWA